MGYGPESADGALLIAMEAKKRTEVGAGEKQLLAYLAILRKNRRKADKTNCISQGFYSDGKRYVFMCITHDGNVLESPAWDITVPGAIRVI